MLNVSVPDGVRMRSTRRRSPADVESVTTVASGPSMARRVVPTYDDRGPPPNARLSHAGGACPPAFSPSSWLAFGPRAASHAVVLSASTAYATSDGVGL